MFILQCLGFCLTSYIVLQILNNAVMIRHTTALVLEIEKAVLQLSGLSSTACLL